MDERILQEIREQNIFILNQINAINRRYRMNLLESSGIHINSDQQDTYASFDYQWDKFDYGNFLQNDTKFMDTIDQYILKMIDCTIEDIRGKSVLDVGCGSGRFSYGFLKLGANHVHSIDISPHGIEKTSLLCEPFKDHHTSEIKDILEWTEPDNYDFVFCFGVVHHTPNVYKAIINTANKVISGGKLFLMVYGIPETLVDFQELNKYNALHKSIERLSFDKRKEIILNMFDDMLAHGYFDAVSPSVNELLTYNEIEFLLLNMGFINIKKVKNGRNHHIITTKAG